MNRTFVMCKPDAVERRPRRRDHRRFERKGLTLVAAELRTADRALAEAHYDEHKERPFYGELVDFLTRAPVMAMVVEGPADNTFSIVRTLIGKTSVDDAQPGTIRGDLATTTNENLVHGSDSPRVGRPRDRALVPRLRVEAVSIRVCRSFVTVR